MTKTVKGARETRAIAANRGEPLAIIPSVGGRCVDICTKNVVSRQIASNRFKISA